VSGVKDYVVGRYNMTFAVLALVGLSARACAPYSGGKRSVEREPPRCGAALIKGVREADMQLLSVNTGAERPIRGAKASGKTGIYKVPVDGPVRVTRDGLAGDEISDKKNHGGVDQAVYLYGIPDYEWWYEELGRELAPGTFGENLTVAGLESARALVGDRLHAGSVVLEVAAPRIPCVTLATRMGDPTFVKRFREAGRPGLYCRVIREGYVRAGEEASYEPYEGEAVGALEVFRDFFEPDVSEAAIRRHLAAPIAVRARVEKEEQLRKLLAGGEAGSRT
jgi:MOSC domain-containing protein YiiM